MKPKKEKYCVRDKFTDWPARVVGKVRESLVDSGRHLSLHVSRFRDACIHRGMQTYKQKLNPYTVGVAIGRIERDARFYLCNSQCCMSSDSKTPQAGRTSLQLTQEELEELERLLDTLSRCSRHRLLIACVRHGLRAFRNDPALIAEGLRDLGVRVRTQTT